MKKQEMAAVLDGLRYAPDHPLWAAVLAVIADYREEAVQRAKDPTLSDKEGNIAIGAVTGADEIKENLERLVSESRKDDGR